MVQNWCENKYRHTDEIYWQLMFQKLCKSNELDIFIFNWYYKNGVKVNTDNHGFDTHFFK